jgi:hypothetical protein
MENTINSDLAIVGASISNDSEGPSPAAVGALMRLLGGFLKNVQRIADAEEKANEMCAAEYALRHAQD